VGWVGWTVHGRASDRYRGLQNILQGTVSNRLLCQYESNEGRTVVCDVCGSRSGMWRVAWWHVPSWRYFPARTKLQRYEHYPADHLRRYPETRVVGFVLFVCKQCACGRVFCVSAYIVRLAECFVCLYTVCVWPSVLFFCIPCACGRVFCVSARSVRMAECFVCLYTVCCGLVFCMYTVCVWSYASIPKLNQIRRKFALSTFCEIW
jgi:hypothetical protein